MVWYRGMIPWYGTVGLLLPAVNTTVLSLAYFGREGRRGGRTPEPGRSQPSKRPTASARGQVTSSWGDGKEREGGEGRGGYTCSRVGVWGGGAGT